MRALLAALLLAAPAAAQPIELLVFGAMVESPEGTPLASATGISGDPDAAVYVTSDAVLTTEGACLRIWSEGPCHPMDAARSQPITGQEGLAWMAVPLPQDDLREKFNRNPFTSMPLVGTFDAATDAAQVTFLTQSAFGGWEAPLTPAPVTGRSGDLYTIRDAALSPLSVGAPVVTPEKGLIGIVVRATDGAAQVADLSRLVEAALADGYPVQEMMRPTDVDPSGLPPRVETELGRVIVFNHWNSQDYLGGFYGPSAGTGFDADFVAQIDFSVWEVAPGGGGTRIAGQDKVLPLNPSGQALEAPYRGGRTGAHLATCVTHQTPSSDGRMALLMQFWRLAPERSTSETGFQSYDDAAPALTAWAEGDTPCAIALADVDAARLQALFGTLPASTDAPAPAPPAAPTAPGDWQSVPAWDATGIDALALDLPAGRLTLGCTESGELAVAITPGAGVDGFAIGGRTAPETGQSGDTAFALFPGSARDQLMSGASIGWTRDGAALDHPAPSADLLAGDC